jgi:hypothetical protein
MGRRGAGGEAVKIRPAHSMTYSEMSIWLSLPRYQGHIVNPACIAHRGAAYDTYLDELRIWCRNHPQPDWPEWLQRFAEEARLAKAQESRRAGAGGSDRDDRLDPVRAVAAGTV